MIKFGTSEPKSFGSVRDFRAQSANNLVQFGTSERRAQIIWFRSGIQSAERKSFGSVRDFRAQINVSCREFRAQSANYLIKFGTSECRSQIIWFNSGLQSADHLIKFGTSERKSFGSVRDFRAQSANNLVQFGTSERRAQIIWFSSGIQSAERKSFGSVRDFRAQSANHLIQFGTSEHRAHVCVCIYIVYEISKGSNMFTKTCFKIYLDKYIFFIFVCYCF